MKKPSIAELQHMARETFGRDLSEAEAQASRARLPGMVRTVSLLEQWGERLRHAEPAVTYSLPALEIDDDGKR